MLMMERDSLLKNAQRIHTVHLELWGSDVTCDVVRAFGMGTPCRQADKRREKTIPPR